MSGTIILGHILGSSRGVTVTSDSNPDTYGSVTPLQASVAANVDRVHIQVRVEAGTNRNFKLQFVTGASYGTDLGAPVPINASSSQAVDPLIFPLRVVAGTQLGVKCMDGTGSGILHVTVQGQTEDPLVPTGALTSALLTDQGGSNGFLTLNTGGAANTWVGSSGNVSASTAADYNCLVVNGRDTTSGNTADSLIQVLVNGSVYIAPTYVRLTNNTARPFVARGEGLISAGSEIRIQFRTSNGTYDDCIAAVTAFNTTAQSGGDTIILQGAAMQRPMKDSETTASRKRIPFEIINDTDGAAWSGSVTGVKAQLSASGATEVASTNDIVRVGGKLHYVELDNTEAAAYSVGDFVTARVAAASGRRESTLGVLEITADDVYLASLSAGDVTTAMFGRAFDAALMSGLTFEEIIGLMASVLLGKVSGLPTAPVFRNIGDTANAVSATTDTTGNRSAVTLTASSVA